MDKPDLVILLSGGYDSAVLLALARQSGHIPVCLLIDYGQKHKVELEKAVELCDRFAVHWRRMRVDLDGLESALTGTQVKSLYEGVSEWHVPGRNLIFLGLAVSLAESISVKKIWYGANYEDRVNRFPDCFQEWVFAMNEVVKRTASYPIELEAPLLGMRKETVKDLGKILMIDEKEVHSGYNSTVQLVEERA